MAKEYSKRSYPVKRLFGKVLFFIARKTPFLPAEFRSFLHYLGGVRIIKPFRTFIGEDVYFDDIYPGEITVGENTRITMGARIITHFMDPDYDDFSHFYKGSVVIGKNVFIGMNTVIAKPVTIGDGAIIGANSVVSQDIPPYTIWGGVPAKLIKSRTIKTDGAVGDTQIQP